MALAPCSNACEQRQPVCVALGLGQAGTRAACTRLAACHKYRWHASQRPRHWAPVAICGRLLPLHAATPCLLSRAGSIGARSRPPSWVLQLSKLGGRHADPAYHSHTMRTPHAHRVRCAGRHACRLTRLRFVPMRRRARAACGPGEQKCSPGDCRLVRLGALCCIATPDELWAREAARWLVFGI